MVPESLPPMWETQIELLAPNSSQGSPQSPDRSVSASLSLSSLPLSLSHTIYFQKIATLTVHKHYLKTTIR